jgi:hypothetical protein
MKFYEIGVGTDFNVEGQEKTFTKVKEERISCCKVKVNALDKDTGDQVVFKPMQEVQVINK